MSLALADVQAWLEAAFPGTPVQLNRLQDQPDEVICINNVGGGSPCIDGAFEEAFLIVRVRAAPNDDTTAETLALAVHAYISANQGSKQMGTTYVMSILPSSGPPTYSGQDVDLRSIYQGSYQVKVAV